MSTVDRHIHPPTDDISFTLRQHSMQIENDVGGTVPFLILPETGSVRDFLRHPTDATNASFANGSKGSLGGSSGEARPWHAD